MLTFTVFARFVANIAFFLFSLGGLIAAFYTVCFPLLLDGKGIKGVNWKKAFLLAFPFGINYMATVYAFGFPIYWVLRVVVNMPQGIIAALDKLCGV